MGITEVLLLILNFIAGTIGVVLAIALTVFSIWFIYGLVKTAIYLIVTSIKTGSC